MNLELIIKQHFNEHATAVSASQKQLEPTIVEAVGLIVAAIKSNNKLLCCGNGGSSGDASHLASELINRFEMERKAIPAIALTTDSAVVTSIANDYHFDKVFSRQIEALGNQADILIAFSTSGNSKNIISAIQTAQAQNLKIIVFTGKNGGEIRKLLSKDDIELCVSAEKTSRIQEIHLILIHCICDLIDRSLFN
jgi:phosphoheptose isomerase